MVKRVLGCFLLLAGLGYFSACNLDFLSDVTALPDGGTSYHYVTSADGLQTRCYDANDNLVWKEIYTKDASGNCLTTHHYSASNVLLYSYAWTYAGNLKQTETKYNGAGALIYKTTYSYNGSSQLILEIQTDSANAVQYMQYKEWTGADLTKAMRFGPSAGSGYPLQWVIVYTYTGALADMEYNYGPDGVMTGTVQHLWNPDSTERRRNYSSNAAAAASPTALTVPAILSAGVAPTGITLTAATVALANYKLWFYDSYGTSRVDLTATHELTRIERSDSRLPRPAGATASSTIVTALTWDNAGRPLKKTTTYNGRTALDVSLAYAADGSIRQLDLAGTAMMLPLTFTVSYKAPGSAGTGSFTNVPNTLNIASSGVALYSFQYVWDAGKLPATPTSTTDLLKLQPSDFQPGVLTINNYDGDNKFLGAYAFSADTGTSPYSLKLAATKPDGTSNGWFSLSYDTAVPQPNTLAFSGYNAAGSLVYSYSYTIDYETALTNLRNQAENTYKQASSYNVDVTKIMQLITSLDPRKIIDALY